MISEITKLNSYLCIRNSFYLISKGRVELIKNGIYVRELESGSCFGENVILYANSKRITSVIATEKVVRCIKFLGRGKFGSVSLVHNKKNIYAIKAISRKSVELQKNVIKIFCE